MSYGTCLSFDPGKTENRLYLCSSPSSYGNNRKSHLKPLFARVRPCDVNQAVQLLIANPGGYSFPSGHTSASFAAASVLCFREKRKVAVPALLLAALIGFSRMYLYVHYPTDIAGGILLGTLMGYVCVQAADRIKYRKNSINIERK